MNWLKMMMPTVLAVVMALVLWKLVGMDNYVPTLTTPPKGGA